METILWYLPTFYGDIRLESPGEATTTLIYEKLSPSEAEAMLSLRERAVRPKWGRRPWASITDFPIPSEQGSGKIKLDAPIEDVQKLLSKALKPGRVLVTAVRFAGGAIEEKREASLAPYRKEGETTEPASGPTPPTPTPEELAAAAALVSTTPTKAVTVAAPVRGCPPPDFENADIRATRVLEAFLMDDQLEDFRRYGQFVSLGHETGHRYLITSRNARERLAKAGGRSLYDLDQPRAEWGGNIIRRLDAGGALVDDADRQDHGFGRAFCVHDWTVPASEEMLALHLFLTMPGREHYLRDIPDTGVE